MKKYIFVVISAFFLLSAESAYAFGTAQSHIQSPEEYVTSEAPAAFLAGSAVFPWREAVKKNISPEEAVLFDPMNDQLAEENPMKRVQWEVDHMDYADIVVVWLPKEDQTKPHTFSLTSLFEMGRFVQMKDKPLVVGIAPEYIRRDELVTQLKVLRPEVTVVNSLDALQEQLRAVALSCIH
jgi:hypothetical protein